MIAATNQDPHEAVKPASCARISTTGSTCSRIELPPLRDRREDIPLLVQQFLNEFNIRNAKSVRAVDQEAMYILERYPWPGNIRELRNVIERATILAEGDFIEAKHLPPVLVSRGEESLPTVTLSPGTTVDEAETTVDPVDAGSHSEQQDARRGDSRDQPEDAAQQTESDERRNGEPKLAERHMDEQRLRPERPASQSDLGPQAH